MRRNVATLPSSIYSFKQGTNKLWTTNLLTGKQSCRRIRSFISNARSCWSELCEGSLIITGGGDPAVRDVLKINILREFAVSELPPMLTPRRVHGAVYHAQCLYVLGGIASAKHLKECERYVCPESRWEALPPLPRSGCGMSGVVVEGSLYALGGNASGGPLDLIQKLRLDDLTWDILEMRLPHIGYLVPCFKLRDSRVYLVMKRTLYSFTPLQVQAIELLSRDIQSCGGPSYYSRGTLYCSNQNGAAQRIEIGDLN
jgi:hypothetical protein